MKFATVRLDNEIVPVIVASDKLVNLQAVTNAMVGGSFRFPVGVALIKAVSANDVTTRQIINAALTKPVSDNDLFTVNTDTIEGTRPWMPPVHDARQIIAVGLNYMSHCIEQNIVPPAEPRFFGKLVSSMTGHKQNVTLWPISKCIDYEGELGVVIGRETRGVTVAQALQHVFGYTIVNDVTARDLQKSDQQWTRAKGLDSFCPMGPFITTADEISDPDNLCIVTTVNGEVRQKRSTSDMLFGVAECISRISQAITLQAGDIISTGTPAGVGLYMKPPRFLNDGDIVSVNIDELGTLTNQFVETVNP